MATPWGRKGTAICAIRGTEDYELGFNLYSACVSICGKRTHCFYLSSKCRIRPNIRQLCLIILTKKKGRLWDHRVVCRFIRLCLSLSASPLKFLLEGLWYHLAVCVPCLSSHLFVFYGVRVILKESKRLDLPRTSIPRNAPWKRRASYFRVH
jgi:hypothetical protein